MVLKSSLLLVSLLFFCTQASATGRSNACALDFVQSLKNQPTEAVGKRVFEEYMVESIFAPNVYGADIWKKMSRREKASKRKKAHQKMAILFQKDEVQRAKISAVGNTVDGNPEIFLSGTYFIFPVSVTLTFIVHQECRFSEITYIHPFKGVQTLSEQLSKTERKALATR